MPVLSNARRERFAQELAKGNTAREAYKLAGYSDCKQSAARLAKEPEVVERMTELAHISALEIGQSMEERILRYAALSKKAEEIGDLATAVRSEDSITKIGGWFAQERENDRMPLGDALAMVLERRKAKGDEGTVH